MEVVREGSVERAVCAEILVLPCCMMGLFQSWLDALVVGLGFLAPGLVLSSLLGFERGWKVEYLKDASLWTWLVGAGGAP